MQLWCRNRSALHSCVTCASAYARVYPCPEMHLSLSVLHPGQGEEGSRIHRVAPPTPTDLTALHHPRGGLVDRVTSGLTGTGAKIGCKKKNKELGCNKNMEQEAKETVRMGENGCRSDMVVQV